jgi:FAD/FMN-containing dehydrogenase
MSTSSTAGPDLHALRTRLEGDVVEPTDARWDAARAAWNLVADQHPALVVDARSAADVAAVVRFAADNDLHVAPQATGHGAAALADLAGTILLRTTAMTAVTVDASARTARAQAGALWRDVIAQTPPGLAVLHGSTGTVGVVGYTAGGGLGWLAREHGLACDHVLALDVVTADGRALRVDAESEPDLFWALRGGGGSHAIVTTIEFGLVELPEVYAGALMWPIADAPAVAHAWLEWTRAVPDTVTSTLKMVRFPPLPQLPESLRGRSLAVITLAHAGDASTGEALVAPLRAVAPAYLDMVGPVPVAALAEIAGDPVDPVPGRGDGTLLRDLDDAAIDRYLELAGPGAQIALLSVELRHLGGALARPADGRGPLGAVEAGYLLYGVGMAMSPDMDAAAGATLDQILAGLAPWSADRTLLGFAERQRGTRGSFAADVFDRLAAIKASYDPDGRIVANHAID